jgi:hypothetical protein
MGKTPGGMLDAIAVKLRERTGRTAGEWTRIVQRSGPAVRKERVAWLMAEHGLGRVAANLVASQAGGGDADYSDPDALLAGLFTGAKAALRPVYEDIVEAENRVRDRCPLAPKRCRDRVWGRPPACGGFLGRLSGGGPRARRSSRSCPTETVYVRVDLRDVSR